MMRLLVVFILTFPVFTAYAHEDHTGGHSTEIASSHSHDMDDTQSALAMDIARMSVLRGVVEIAVTVGDTDISSVSLLNRDDSLAKAYGTASSFQIDTGTLRDGVHWLRVEVEDSAGHETRSAEVPVVIANSGKEEKITYHPEAKYHIPTNHKKIDHHVRGMIGAKEGVTRIVSWLTWDKDFGCNMEFAVGQGICPHRGVRYMYVESTDGEIIIDMSRNDLAAHIVDRLPEDDQWSDTFPYNTNAATFGSYFAHVAVMDPEEHVEETIPIDIHFILFY